MIYIVTKYYAEYEPAFKAHKLEILCAFKSEEAAKKHISLLPKDISLNGQYIYSIIETLLEE